MSSEPKMPVFRTDPSPWRFTARVFFEWAWRQLADHGLCDSEGGAEYVRVAREWVADGYPRDVIAYILNKANLTLPRLVDGQLFDGTGAPQRPDANPGS